MNSKLFKQIVKDITNYNVNPLPEYLRFFKQRYDALGRLSISPIMKCISAIRQFTYDTRPNAFDEYLHNFTKCIYTLHFNEFLRKPD